MPAILRRMVDDVALDMTHFANVTTLELDRVNTTTDHARRRGSTPSNTRARHLSALHAFWQVYVKTLRGMPTMQRQLQRIICRHSLLHFADLFLGACPPSHVHPRPWAIRLTQPARAGTLWDVGTRWER